MNSVQKMVFFTMSVLLVFIAGCDASGQSINLRLVFIRHAEKPDDGDNLNCKGLNRSMLLPAVLFKKFGKPNEIYVPVIRQGEVTKRARMLETILPFAVKYYLPVNTEYEENDREGISQALANESGTIIIVWEHKFIEGIIKHLGIKNSPHWKDNDFDSIWIITFKKGKAALTVDREGINPGANCNF